MTSRARINTILIMMTTTLVSLWWTCSKNNYLDLFGHESWTLTVEFHRRKQAMEMRCYRKILRFSFRDHVTNKELRAKIQQAIGPHEDLLTMVKRRKL